MTPKQYFNNASPARVAAMCQMAEITIDFFKEIAEKGITAVIPEPNFRMLVARRLMIFSKYENNGEVWRMPLCQILNPGDVFVEHKEAS